MQLVRQEKFGQCLAACCAMLVGKDLQYVLDRCKLRERNGVAYLSDREAIIFLVNHGIMYGAGYRMHRQPDCEFKGDTPFNIDGWVDLGKQDCVLTVPSATRVDMKHAVIWSVNDNAVLDPAKDGLQSLRWYYIHEIVPITRIDGWEDTENGTW